MNSVFIYIVNAIVNTCVLLLFIAILLDFLLYQSKTGVKREMRSIVATGSMFLFFIMYYLVLRLGLGSFDTRSAIVLMVQIIIGLILIITGVAINIAGRIQLKGNWANHIKIYENHSMITSGVYSYMRHPLYSSIIMMLFGGSLVYSNWLSAVFTSIIFVPFMVFRAKQEEQMLTLEFSDYNDYQHKVGLFFPKHVGGYKK